MISTNKTAIQFLQSEMPLQDAIVNYQGRKHWWAGKADEQACVDTVVDCIHEQRTREWSPETTKHYRVLPTRYNLSPELQRAMKPLLVERLDSEDLFQAQAAIGFMLSGILSVPYVDRYIAPPTGVRSIPDDLSVDQSLIFPEKTCLVLDDSLNNFMTQMNLSATAALESITRSGIEFHNTYPADLKIASTKNLGLSQELTDTILPYDEITRQKIIVALARPGIIQYQIDAHHQAALLSDRIRVGVTTRD